MLAVYNISRDNPSTLHIPTHSFITYSILISSTEELLLRLMPETIHTDKVTAPLDTEAPHRLNTECGTRMATRNLRRDE